MAGVRKTTPVSSPKKPRKKRPPKPLPNKKRKQRCRVVPISVAMNPTILDLPIPKTYRNNHDDYLSYIYKQLNEIKNELL